MLYVNLVLKNWFCWLFRLVVMLYVLRGIWLILRFCLSVCWSWVVLRLLCVMRMLCWSVVVKWCLLSGMSRVGWFLVLVLWVVLLICVLLWLNGVVFLWWCKWVGMVRLVVVCNFLIVRVMLCIRFILIMNSMWFNLIVWWWIIGCLINRLFWILSLVWWWWLYSWLCYLVLRWFVNCVSFGMSWWMCINFCVCCVSLSWFVNRYCSLLVLILFGVLYCRWFRCCWKMLGNVSSLLWCLLVMVVWYKFIVVWLVRLLWWGIGIMCLIWILIFICVLRWWIMVGWCVVWLIMVWLFWWSFMMFRVSRLLIFFFVVIVVSLRWCSGVRWLRCCCVVEFVMRVM